VHRKVPAARRARRRQGRGVIAQGASRAAGREVATLEGDPGKTRREDPSPLLADLDCAVRGSGPAAPRLRRALSSLVTPPCRGSVCHGPRSRRAGPSARRLSCWLPDELASLRARWPRAASCRGVRAGSRAGRRRCPGWGGASLPSVLSGGSVLPDLHLPGGPARVSKSSPGRRGDLVRTIPAGAPRRRSAASWRGSRVRWSTRPGQPVPRVLAHRGGRQGNRSRNHPVTGQVPAGCRPRHG